MLEGESLLNDATALVLLRSAVAASAAGFSLGARSAPSPGACSSRS
jgi:CPA1 family monovalent cation:H+ antiporter